MRGAIIFSLTGVLANRHLLQRHFRQGMAQIMTRRYGLTAADWIAAQQAIVADWASYHADLNFSGDDSMAHVREGRYRTTRALFLRTGYPEPAQAEITELAETLIASAPASGNALYPAATDILHRCHHQGWHVAVMSYWPQSQLEAVLRGAGVADFVRALGVDTFEQYEHNARFFRLARAHLDVRDGLCRVVTQRADVGQAARDAGCRAHVIPAGALRLSAEPISTFLRSDSA